MTTLAWWLIRGSGWPRNLLLAASTAFVSGTALLVIAVLRLPAEPAERLFQVVSDPGTRKGAALAALLLTAPALLLLYQAVRLGSAARDRRLAALRVVGATVPEIRVLGALEVGLPAAAGSVLGIGVYLVLRVLFGGDPSGAGTNWSLVSAVRLVPTTVVPTWWQTVGVVVGVTALSTLVGWAASRTVTTTPLAVSRRQRRAAPRPWGLVVVAVAAVGFWFSIRFDDTELLILAAAATAVIGAMSLASWLGFRVARAVEARTGSAPMLLAARRITADPRAVGRAAAAVGAVSLVAGSTAGLVAQLLQWRQLDFFFAASVLLVLVLLVIALLFVTVSMSVHGVESLLGRRRETAALVALGSPLEELELSQRYEGALVAMPMAALGVLLGAFGYAGFFFWAIFSTDDGTQLPLLGFAIFGVVTLVFLVGTLALVWLAIKIAVAGVRPWFRRATSTSNLRTE